jgi:hypothetical protein
MSGLGYDALFPPRRVPSDPPFFCWWKADADVVLTNPPYVLAADGRALRGTVGSPR